MNIKDSISAEIVRLTCVLCTVPRNWSIHFVGTSKIRIDDSRCRAMATTADSWLSYRHNWYRNAVYCQQSNAVLRTTIDSPVPMGHNRTSLMCNSRPYHKSIQYLAVWSPVMLSLWCPNSFRLSRIWSELFILSIYIYMGICANIDGDLNQPATIALVPHLKIPVIFYNIETARTLLKNHWKYLHNCKRPPHSRHQLSLIQISYCIRWMLHWQWNCYMRRNWFYTWAQWKTGSANLSNITCS